MSHTGTPGVATGNQNHCRTKYGCGACRFFDCGFYCQCGCHDHPMVRKPIFTGVNPIHSKGKGGCHA